jgi:hypothetical protein
MKDKHDGADDVRDQKSSANYLIAKKNKLQRDAPREGSKKMYI